MQLKVSETWSLDHADISRYLFFLLTPPEQKVTVAQTQLVSPKKGEPDFSENPLFFTLGICLKQWVKGKIEKSTPENRKINITFGVLRVIPSCLVRMEHIWYDFGKTKNFGVNFFFYQKISDSEKKKTFSKFWNLTFSRFWNFEIWDFRKYQFFF